MSSSWYIVLEAVSMTLMLAGLIQSLLQLLHRPDGNWSILPFHDGSLPTVQKNERVSEARTNYSIHVS